MDPAAYELTEAGLSLAEQFTARADAASCADWIRRLVEIRSVRKAGLMHGKLVHVRDKGRDHAMVGSSNFTLAGLGFGRGNIELNLVVDGDRDRADLRAWFDEVWRDETLTVDVKAEVLERLERLYRHNSPEFIYHKTLLHLFEGDLADQSFEDLPSSRRLLDSAIWNMLFEFQRDGVKACLQKLGSFGGCVLADSVGLGKTFTALAVVKYYEGKGKRVLVLCPKKLRENWVEHRRNIANNPLRDDSFRYDVLSHTDVNRRSGEVGDIDLASHDLSDYDLIVIDESHNFRNPTGSRYRQLLERILSPGRETDVLLLSATPVNNDLADLKAQLELIAHRRPDTFASLGAPDMRALISAARRRFLSWAKEPIRDPAALMRSLPGALTTLLDGVSLARSRKQIERHYAASLDQIGRFPRREKPLSVFVPHIDSAREFPDYSEVDGKIGSLKLALYNPFSYVLPEHIHRYDPEGDRPAGFDQGNRERYLVAMLKVGFLKRLESSISSFGRTMDRIEARIRRQLADIERYRDAQVAVSAEQLDAEELEADDELAAAFEVGKGLRYDLRHLRVEDWARDLRHDLELIAELAAQARKVDAQRDAKLAEIRKLVEAKVAQPTRNRDGTPNRKLILFTAYADTAAYLYRELAPLARGRGLHAAMVAGTTCDATLGEARFQDILVNFAPRSKRRPGSSEGEIDLLIATDCISEGQNLQDCDLLVNVDIHWNPVRLIQRFGRIDRIGAVADTIRMVNFWPTADLDQYLDLKDRVEARMALVDLSATGEDNPLADMQTSAEAETNWRDEQLRRLQTESFDLEDAADGVALTEFTLNDFRAELTAALKRDRDALADAPLGLYAVAPAGGTLEPGVIFCLRRRGAELTEAAKVAPLDPFYLVYVRDDHSVRHGFTQPKTVLTAMQALCAGRAEPIEALCDAFDRETERGTRMDRYTALAEEAVRSIVGDFGARALSGLATGRGGKLPDKAAQPASADDFELVTWLVVRTGDEA